MDKKMYLTEFSGEKEILNALNTGKVLLKKIEYLEEEGQAPCISMDLKDESGRTHCLMFNGDGIWFYGREKSLMISSLMYLLPKFNEHNDFKYWIDNGALYGGDKKGNAKVIDLDSILSYTVDREGICIEIKGNYETIGGNVKLTPDGPEM